MRRILPYQGYLLTMLMLLMALNSVDRIALGLLLQNIKVDLALSDTQLGLLTGVAFAFFYSLMGIPLARWTDRGNRVVVIALTTLLWSIALVLCGFAASFAQLLLIRIFVAVGEAGLQPAAHSLIGSTFARSERARAVAWYMLGVPISSMLGFLVAGWLNQLYGWRTTFMLLALPALLLALLALATLRDPRSRTRSGSTSAKPDEAAPVPENAARVPENAEPAPVDAEVQPPSAAFYSVLKELAHNRAFRNLTIGFALLIFFSQGMSKWMPSFFIRSFGMETGELGTWLALVYGTTGFVGTILGGALATRFAPANEKLQLAACTFAYVIAGFAYAAAFLSPNQTLALLMIGVGAFGSFLVNAPLMSTLQSLVPDRMRATAIAVIFLIANLIGMGLGPLAAGMISDALTPYFGNEAMRLSLLVFCPGFALAALLMWRASRTVCADIESASLQDAAAVGSLGLQS